MTPLNPKTHSNQYPDSYYFATANAVIDRPFLQDSKRVDVCVIGAGFTGINTAIELAERGYSVIVLEAFRVGWGASGRNGGQLIRGIGHDLEPFRKQVGEQGINALDQMGFEAVRIVRERISRFKIDCDLTMGYCDLATRPSHIEMLEKEYQHLTQSNYDANIELIPGERIHEVVGSDRYLSGLVDMGSGHLHPLNLCLGEAKAAEQLGVQIFEYSPVQSIESGQGYTIHTEQGQVSCENLVVCTNAYIGKLNKSLSGKVLPAGSYVLATQPLTEQQAAEVLPQNMAVCDQNVALDYFRLSADRRLLFGGLCNYSGRDPNSIEASLRPHLERVFPQLKGIAIDYQWGGMIGIGANRFPQIGRLKPNWYYAQAYSGHGLNVSHLAARVIAESIHQQSTRIDLFEKVQHMTFPGGPMFRSPMLALGMLYYRIKELIG